jgi:SAM-dependent methyltransferase
VLDLACGQGRHGVPLAGHGFQVVGLAYQAHLLSHAMQQATANGACFHAVRGDMRALPFAGGFAAVINMFTAFGYFSDEENFQVLREIARVLLPGGFLFLDLANRDALLLRHREPRTWKVLRDGALLLSEWLWDPITNRYSYPQILIDEHGQQRFYHSVRLYTASEITELLRHAGLRVLEYYGGFQGETLSVDSPRMILLAEK